MAWGLVPGQVTDGEGNGTPLRYSCLENPLDGGAWWAAVHGIAKSPTRLSNFTFTFHFHALEKEMATHSSVLAWRIPGTGEPGGLPSMGSHRVGHDWSDLAAAGNWNPASHMACHKKQTKKPQQTKTKKKQFIRQIDYKHISMFYFKPVSRQRNLKVPLLADIWEGKKSSGSLLLVWIQRVSEIITYL